MKVVAFNGSPRKGGNTEHLIKMVFAELEKEGIATELVQLGGQKVQGCRACFRCFEQKGTTCAIESDMINDCIAKVLEADAVIIGSPTYFCNVTAETKALIDRLGSVAMTGGGLLKRKIGAAVVAARRSGSSNAFDAINKLFLYSEMLVAGSNSWNLGMGLHHGEVADDPEGVGTMKMLGENMAWLLKKMNG